MHLRINIFEGSRRVALLLGAIATIGTAIAVVTYDPYVSVMYTIARPDGSLVKMDEPCPVGVGRHYFDAEVRKGKSVNVTLCLSTMRFDNGGELVPYRIDEQGMIWGASPYSSEVTTYAQALERRFRMSPHEQAAISSDISRRWWRNAKDSVKYLAIGLGLWAICVAVIGWIVRGFLGIPRGMDRRPDSSA